MENLIWVIYLIDVICGDMRGLYTFLSISLFVSLSGWFLEPALANNKEFEWLRKIHFGKVVSLIISIMFFSNFIPSQDTAYKMLAVYGVSEVAKNDNVQELMGDGYDILKLTLKDYKDKLEKGAVEGKQ